MWDFFTIYVHLPNFDISSDSFSTIREILTKDKSGVCANFLSKEYDKLFTHYNTMLLSTNYITRRLSLKLLSDLLLDRTNFSIMMRYISSKANLKTLMNLLRDPSPHIQFEAFHVFKVFVANPRKPDDVARILYNNKVKLVGYLKGFHIEKEGEDKQFKEEKGLVLNTLANLVEPKDKEQEVKEAAAAAAKAEVRTVAASEATVEGNGDIIDPR